MFTDESDRKLQSTQNWLTAGRLDCFCCCCFSHWCPLDDVQYCAGSQIWTARPGDILPSSQFCHSVYLNLLHLFEPLITPPDVLSVNYSSTEKKNSLSLSPSLSLSLPPSPTLQHFIRIFKQSLTDINFQEWVVWLNASGRFDLYREFKTALNAETYTDCIKQKWFRDCLVRIRLGISNLKVHKNRYAKSEELMDDCPLCPGMQNNELHLFFVCKKYEKIRSNMLKNTEPHHEHCQSVKLMSCHVDSVTRQIAWFLFKRFETRHRLFESKTTQWSTCRVKTNTA